MEIGQKYQRERYFTNSVYGFIFILGALIFSSSLSGQVRIKEVAGIQGMEAQRVTGYGLVMGLAGTGDGTTALFTIQSVANLLRNMGLTIDQNRIRMRNVAAVMVNTELPSFTKQGTRSDVIVSSMGDASSLEGGTLIETPLFDVNREIIAYAEGPITVGGRNIAGAGGGARQNYVLSGRIQEGARAVKELPLRFIADGAVKLALNRPDFTTAVRIAERVNRTFKEPIAVPLDAGTVVVNIPQTYIDNNNIIAFISQVELLQINPDVIAKVVVNERTGTVIVGGDVRISPVAISHGDLSIQIQAAPAAAPVPGAAPQAAQQKRMVVLGETEGNSVQNLAEALNALSVTPKDVIAIFQALKQAGALQAELVVL
ncbi:MAG: flagellar basal body P-ring protein FlgI [Patescibacteria group bacterium]|nr:flagellar basal body P-ring protein FlgI [Patescibacteria group bacterium]